MRQKRPKQDRAAWLVRFSQTAPRIPMRAGEHLSGGRSCFAKTVHLLYLTLLLGGFLPGRVAGADSGVSSPPASVPIIDALEAQAAAMEKDFSNRVSTANRQARAVDNAASGQGTIWVVLTVVLAGILAWHKLAPALGEFRKRRKVDWAVEASAAAIAEDEESFSRFATAFTAGPSKPVSPEPNKAVDPDTRPQPNAPQDKSKPNIDPVAVFLAGSSRDLAAIRIHFSSIARAPDDTARQATLARMLRRVRSLKAKSELPEMLPVWQMACALEELLDKITERPAESTPSAFRTLAGAIDLLHALCVRGLRPDLASDPPVRLLAVDDDPVTRFAVAFALKKFLAQPDLAADGAAAIDQAEKQAYDVIFVDVEMPGMDGFEACFRIHGTAANQTTPVVFVTSHSDIVSRAKSSLTGGQDMLSKPFLASELAVKALTLVLRRRLQTPAVAMSPVPSANGASLCQPQVSPASPVEQLEVAAPQQIPA